MGAAASDIADWWDEQHRTSKKAVDRFVDDNPNLFGVVVGTAAITVMEMGAGLVDVLRFGQGAAEGGVGGFAKDSLRLLGIVGPTGKVLKYANMARGARLSRLILDPGGGTCSWVAGSMALTRTGTRLAGGPAVFTSVVDLARVVGQPIARLGVGFPFRELIKVLKQLGAKVGTVREIKTLDDIAQLTKPNGSVVLVSLKSTTEATGHTIVAYRDAFHRLRFLDRGGTRVTLPRIYSSLDDIARKYDTGFEPVKAAVMDNVFVKIVDGSAELAMSVFFTTLAATQKQNETIAQTFEIHKKVVAAGPAALATPKARYHTVIAGECLSRLARQHYGDMQKWPIIHVANKGVIGKNPNLIRPGQKLVIPDLPRVPKTGRTY